MAQEGHIVSSTEKSRAQKHCLAGKPQSLPLVSGRLFAGAGDMPTLGVALAPTGIKTNPPGRRSQFPRRSLGRTTPPMLTQALAERLRGS